MNQDQLAKMQAGRRAALQARQDEIDRLAGDAQAQFDARHEMARQDAVLRRQALRGHHEPR